MLVLVKIDRGNLLGHEQSTLSQDALCRKVGTIVIKYIDLDVTKNSFRGYWKIPEKSVQSANRIFEIGIKESF